MSYQTQPLINLLNNHFNLNLSRTKCLAGLILSMIKLQTINLANICNGFESKIKPASTYRRLQRFIKEEMIPARALAKLIVSIKGLDKGLDSGDNKDKGWKLTMDRTNWKIGKIHINILYLAVCHKNVAIPLFSHF